MAVIYLIPSEILFSQDSIIDKFDDKTIEEAFRELLNNKLNASQLRALTVYEDNEKYWVLSGHRRLYIYKKLEELKMLKEVPAMISRDESEFRKKKRNKSGGRSIEIISDRKYKDGNKLADRLNNIVAEYDESLKKHDVVFEEEPPGGPTEGQETSKSRKRHRYPSGESEASTASNDSFKIREKEKKGAKKKKKRLLQKEIAEHSREGNCSEEGGHDDGHN